MSNAALVGVLEWGDPPPPVSTHRTRTKRKRPWALVASELRQNPGVWGLVDNESRSPALVGRIKTGESWWAPEGAFEATTRTINGVICTWARYVGEPDQQETP